MHSRVAAVRSAQVPSFCGWYAAAVKCRLILLALPGVVLALAVWPLSTAGAMTVSSATQPSSTTTSVTPGLEHHDHHNHHNDHDDHYGTDGRGFDDNVASPIHDDDRPFALQWNSGLRWILGEGVVSDHHDGDSGGSAFSDDNSASGRGSGSACRIAPGNKTGTSIIVLVNLHRFRP